MSSSITSGRPVTRDRRIHAAVTIALTTLATGGVASALDKHWNNANALWGNASAWNLPGVPGTGDIALVDLAGGGIASVNQAQVSPVSIKVFNGNRLSVVDGPGIIGGGFGPETEDGVIGTAGDLIVGFGNTAGTFTISHSDFLSGFDGQVNVGATMRVGVDSGIGTVIQSAGTVTVGQYLRIADSNSGAPVASGTYNLSGGVLNATNLHLGYGNHPDSVGVSLFMQGFFNLSGSGVLTTGAGSVDVQIGGSGSSGTFTQTGGTFISTLRVIDMARSEGLNGNAVYNYSGGSVSIPGMAFSSGNGTVNYLNGANLSLGQVQMAAGQILLAAGHNKTLRIPGGLLVSGTTWKVDVNDNSAVLGTIFGETIRSAISRGYNGGAWTGTGLTSTAAKNDASHHTALGYALASQVLTPSGGVFTFHGQTVTGTSIIVKYTYYGDADLDGDTDGVDIGKWAVNFTGELGGGAGATKSWNQGDWDYDGDVDGIDAGLWATAFTGELGGGGLEAVYLETPLNPQAQAILSGLGITVVPEPAVFGLFALGLTGVASRRHPRAIQCPP